MFVITHSKFVSCDTQTHFVPNGGVVNFGDSLVTTQLSDLLQTGEPFSEDQIEKKAETLPAALSPRGSKHY